MKQRKRVPGVVHACYGWCMENKLLILGSFVSLAVLLTFTQQVKVLLIVGILAAVGSASQMYRRFARIPPALELVTFGTVIVGYTYGPWAGLLFGLAVGLTAEILSGALDAFIVAYLPARMIIGAVAGLMAGYSISSAGIMLVILYNVIAQPLYFLQADMELRAKAVFYIIVNIGFNVLLFKFWATPVQSLL